MSFSNQTLDELESTLGNLALQWRGAQDESAVRFVIEKKYRDTLNTMLRRGFSAPLDVDAELPDELMPEAYLRMRRGKPELAASAGVALKFVSDH